MRDALIQAVIEVAKTDDRIWLLTGDLGYSVLEPLRDAIGCRFINAGIAEQNMTGVAAGLALAGKIVFTYSIANFPTLRCLEQIRNDVCYHNLPVKIVAVGGGLAYGSLGYTHHAVEDIAIMRSLPNMTVLAPGDPNEAKSCLRHAINCPGPTYVRLGKAGEQAIHSSIPDRIDTPIEVLSGRDITVLATGGGLSVAFQACKKLTAEGVSPRLLSVPCLHPIDLTGLCGPIVTVEDHGIGGLGSIVAEHVALTHVDAIVKCVRLHGTPTSLTGSMSQLQNAGGLSEETVIAAVNGLLSRRKYLNVA